MARVIVYAAPPWQSQGTLLDYELQYERNGQWVTIEHVKEPTRTLCVFTPPTRTTVDSFFSDRWIFQHQFPPVTTQKIRLLVHDCTWGDGATKEETEAGGQTGPAPGDPARSGDLREVINICGQFSMFLDSDQARSY